MIRRNYQLFDHDDDEKISKNSVSLITSSDSDSSSIPSAFSAFFLLQLPLEIRIYIYRLLPRKDQIQLRLINRSIKEEIEEYVDFSIRLDDSFPFCRRLVNLRVDSCKISNLRFFRRTIFKYPERILKLVLDGIIKPHYLSSILESANHLRELTFTHEALAIKNVLSSKRIKEQIQHLPYLTYLNLQFLRYPTGDPFEHVDNITVFLDSTFPNLRTFKLYYSVWGNWIDLFLFLTRHSHTLTSIELQVGDRGDSSNTKQYLARHNHTKLIDLVDVAALRKFRFVDFRFRDDVLHLNPTVKQFIFTILSHQTLLETLHFHSPGDMDVTTLSNLVTANHKTLKELAIYNLRSGPLRNNNVAGADLNPLPLPVPSIDMEIFSKCTNLTILALSCNPTPTGNNRNENLETHPIEMTRINLIPDSLIRFHLTGFSFNPEDIIRLSHNVPNLKELLVIDAGRMTYSTVLTNILKNCPRLEYLNISPLTTRGSSPDSWWFELRELNKLYQRFMNVHYDPVDDLDGFEAHVSDQDREWIKENMET